MPVARARFSSMASFYTTTDSPPLTKTTLESGRRLSSQSRKNLLKTIFRSSFGGKTMTTRTIVTTTNMRQAMQISSSSSSPMEVCAKFFPTCFHSVIMVAVVERSPAVSSLALQERVD